MYAKTDYESRYHTYDQLLTTLKRIPLNELKSNSCAIFLSFLLLIPQFYSSFSVEQFHRCMPHRANKPTGKKPEDETTVHLDFAFADITS